MIYLVSRAQLKPYALFQLFHIPSCPFCCFHDLLPFLLCPEVVPAAAFVCCVQTVLPVLLSIFEYLLNALHKSDKLLSLCTEKLYN